MAPHYHLTQEVINEGTWQGLTGFCRSGQGSGVRGGGDYFSNIYHLSNKLNATADYNLLHGPLGNLRERWLQGRLPLTNGLSDY